MRIVDLFYQNVLQNFRKSYKKIFYW